MSSIHVCTIGFTQTSARSFFSRLNDAGVRKVIDVRLHNTSQLSGFAKEVDLRFFLLRLGKIKYLHVPLLAPTDDMLKEYKKNKGSWGVYQGRFLELMEQRRIHERIKPGNLDGVCLLCSEATPDHCHRRLVCEFLNDKWGGVIDIKHI